jgi:hypothetical protein
MARANFLWGARRIHGELLKLGIIILQATVSRYMPVSHGGDRKQKWRTFVRNRAAAIGPSKGTLGSTSGLGRTLSSVVLQHLLQQRSPDRRVGECGIWQVYASFWGVKRSGSELPYLMPFLSPWRYCNGLCEVSRLPRRKYCGCSILN